METFAKALFEKIDNSSIISGRLNHKNKMTTYPNNIFYLGHLFHCAFLQYFIILNHNIQSILFILTSGVNAVNAFLLLLIVLLGRSSDTRKKSILIGLDFFFISIAFILFSIHVGSTWKDSDLENRTKVVAIQTIYQRTASEWLISCSFLLTNYTMLEFRVKKKLLIFSTSLCVCFLKFWEVAFIYSEMTIFARSTLILWLFLLISLFWIINTYQGTVKLSLCLLEKSFLCNSVAMLIYNLKSDKALLVNSKMHKLLEMIPFSNPDSTESKLNSLEFKSYRKPVPISTRLFSERNLMSRQEKILSLADVLKSGRDSKYLVSFHPEKQDEKLCRRKSRETSIRYNSGMLALTSTDSEMLTKSEKKSRNIEAKRYKVKFQDIEELKDITIISFFDITESFKIIENNNENNHNYKVNLLNGLSHELRTPLNQSQIVLEHAVKDPFISADIKDRYLRQPLNSIHLLNLMIQDILDYLKLETDQVRSFPTNFNPKSFLKEVYELLEPKAKEKGIKFELKIEHSLPNNLVKFDRNLLLRIITNFALNSIKYTFHGFVKIEASSQRLNMKTEALNLVLSVSDSRFSDVSEIKSWENYVSEEKKDNDKNELKLIINKNLINAFLPYSDSYICTVSQYGIIHRITLPFEDLASNPQLIRRSHFSKFSSKELKLSFDPVVNEPRWETCLQMELSKIGSKPNLENQDYILIVDDEAFNLLALEMNISKEGLSVLKALNGRIALNLVKAFFGTKEEPGTARKIILALMDLDMPIMDGFECTEKLLELMQAGNIPRFPIFACSANDSMLYKQRCDSIGMAGFVSKPVTQSVLGKILGRNPKGVF